MGLFEMFPYSNLQELNIQWVINVCEKTEKQMKHLNTTIENVVRPLINEYEAFVKNYYNQLYSVLNAGISKMEQQNELLQQRVNRQLFQNQMLINQTLAQVQISNRENRELTELSISEMRTEVNNLLRKYESIFGANAALQDSRIKKIIDDFSRKYDALIADQNMKMNQLKIYVENQITAMRMELDAASNQLRMEMDNVRMYAANITGSTISRLNQIGDDIITEINRDKTNVTEFYKNIQHLFDTYYSYIDIRFDKKADYVWVGTELLRLESMISAMKDDIIVINPVTSKQDTLQNTLNSIYVKKTNPLQLTADEYDALELTADQYDRVADEGMTATEYDDRGRWWLIMQKGIIDIANAYTDEAETRLNNIYAPWISQVETENNIRWEYIQKCCKDVNIQLQQLMYMSSPFDGERRPLKDIILQMFSWIQTDTLTATEYDNLELTATEYDNKLITAYEYDWHGKSILGGTTLP